MADIGLAAVGALAVIVAGVVVTGFRDKKKNKLTCNGCPNYSNCRAHIGCGNNPNNRK